MKATEAKLLEFLHRSPQFVIPIYQRTYSWTAKECQQLWGDILRTGGRDDIAAHFIGSIVYIEEGLYQVSSRSPLLVIDGQQRMTTLMLLLEALARHLQPDDHEPLDGFSTEKLRAYYLLNRLEKGERRFKLILTQTDRDTLLALMEQRQLPANPSIRISDNFAYFLRSIEALGDDVTDLCRGLAKLMIVDIALSRDQDNPQLIFESMNSTGRELTQADLIRNFVLMGLEPDHQKGLYSQHWRPMETAFGQEAYGRHFDGFMRHYLTVKTGEVPKIRAVYEAFKRYTRAQDVSAASVDELVKEIHTYSGYYCAMALDQELDKELAAAFRDIRELKVDVAFPFLLELYHDFDRHRLSKDEFLRAVRLVEAYVFRRAVCAIPTNSLNKTFATFARALKKDRYLESIETHFLTLPSYRRFPNNQEFKRELSHRNLYNFPRRSYWLRRLENYGRKELVALDEYTIEHILPQNEHLSEEWRRALGPNWRQVRETWLHTLGNLTLTRYNAEYSDHPFTQKRDMPGGFRKSPLQLNEELGSLDTWDQDAIKQRAGRLAEQAVHVWARPTLSVDIQEMGVGKAVGATKYTLDDHPSLHGDTPIRKLFEALRKEVLRLDPCVFEDVLKLYVAYKAETNFVDVVPQQTRLKLTLNMRFHELNDPKGIAKDVTNLGRWGNGDVEVVLQAREELPYIMGLVGQAFEQQMGDGVAAG